MILRIAILELVIWKCVSFGTDESPEALCFQASFVRSGSGTLFVVFVFNHYTFGTLELLESRRGHETISRRTWIAHGVEYIRHLPSNSYLLQNVAHGSTAFHAKRKLHIHSVGGF